MRQDQGNRLWVFVLNELRELNRVQPIDGIEGVRTGIARTEAFHDALRRARAQSPQDDLLRVVDTALGDKAVRHESLIEVLSSLFGLFGARRSNARDGS